jgi:1,4-alpha-glucan branching enzyme
MGSPPTLDPTPTRPPATDRDGVAGDGKLLKHLQTPAAFGGHEFGNWPVDQIANGFGGDLDTRHRHDHTRLADEFTHTHPEIERDPVRDAERAFDRLNPDYGVPADQRSRFGRQAVQDREAALALGVRVAVHDSRQNDRNPVIWQPGQDYRAADAIHAARRQPTRAPHGPERAGPER